MPVLAAKYVVASNFSLNGEFGATEKIAALHYAGYVLSILMGYINATLCSKYAALGVSNP